MESKSTVSAASPRTWAKLAWLVPGLLAAMLTVIVLARWLSHLPAMQSFMTAYPGRTRPPQGTPVGFPAWLGWQHFFNTLVILLLIRSGWAVRTTVRPDSYWTRNNRGILRTKNPPRKISLDQWFHLNLGALLTLNGAAFYALLFTTGQWKRLIPTGWDVFPNAASAAIQYAALDWPTDRGWTSYNALQLLTYFSVVFVAAPVAIITGVRMSGAWPADPAKLNRLFPIQLARAVHLPTMAYFAGFIVVHVTLVLATGARRNLNHMYAMRDDTSWMGAAIFAVSLLVIAAVWIVAQPLFLRPVAALTGTLSKR